MHFPSGNATDQIWRVLASSDGISSWTPLKPHRLPAFLESLMPLKNRCSIYVRCSESSLKHSIRFYGILPSLKQNFIAYHSSKVSSRPDCIFEIHQLRQSGFSRVYFNCCCSCSFEAEIIKIGQSSHKMYSNKILNFQESTTILDARTKKSGILLKAPRICGGKIYDESVDLTLLFLLFLILDMSLLWANQAFFQVFFFFFFFFLRLDQQFSMIILFMRSWALQP